MTPRLNNELSKALEQSSGPLEVQDELGQQSYVIVSKEQYRRLLEHEFIEWMKPALEQNARGEVEEWDLEAVRAEIHRRHENRHPS